MRLPPCPLPLALREALACLGLAALVAAAACRPDAGPARPAAPAQGHTVRLAVASEAGVPQALPRLLLTLLQQELSRAGLNAAEADEPGSAGTLAILIQTIGPPATAPSLVPARAAAPPAEPPRKAPQAAPAREPPPLRITLRSPGTGSDTAWIRRIGRCCSARAFAAIRQEARRRLALVTGKAPPPSPPLWPGTAAHRDFLADTLLAGLRWLLGDALRPEAPALSDPLQVFLILSRSARDPSLRRLGRDVGPLLARRFFARAPLPRSGDDPSMLCDLAAGLHFAEGFGVRAPDRLGRLLGAAIRGAGPRLIEREHPRSESRRLLDAVVDLYFLHRLGLPSPRPYAEVISEARRFPLTTGPEDTAKTLEERVYLASHLVYVLSDFGRHGLAEADVAPLVRFFERAVPHFLAARDLETLGEVADSLKIAGRSYQDPWLRRVMLALLTGQNPDGSFGNPAERRPYVRFHTTWTAVNGLLEYRFDGQGPTDPIIARAWRTARPRP